MIKLSLNFTDLIEYVLKFWYRHGFCVKFNSLFDSLPTKKKLSNHANFPKVSGHAKTFLFSNFIIFFPRPMKEEAFEKWLQNCW